MPLKDNYYCICQKNFIGQECEINLNSINQLDKQNFGCALRPCWLGSTCEDLTHLGGTFKCHCSANTYGEFCEKTTLERNDPCKANPCFNKGTCENIDDMSYRCICNSSYGGVSCKHNLLGPCSTMTTPCKRDSVCISTDKNDYKCNCQDWTIGRDCELVFNPCQYINCPNGGVCLKRRTLAYECRCAEGFTGYMCSQRTNETCLKHGCLNGKCMLNESNGEWHCVCDTDGFTGKFCEIEQCEPRCINGVCKMNSMGSFECECSQGHTGPSCSDLSCFSGDMFVETINGKQLRISELKYGDLIKTYDSVEKTVKFTKVLAYLHRDERTLTKYLLIKTSKSDMIKISARHLIAKQSSNQQQIEFVFAESLVEGDCLIDQFGNNRTTISSIRTVFEKGAFAPLTEDGGLFVNNIFVSCYSKIKSHYLAHFAMKPLIFMSKYHEEVLSVTMQQNIIKSNSFSGSVLHYAKFLYDMVMMSPTQVSQLIF